MGSPIVESRHTPHPTRSVTHPLKGDDSEFLDEYEEAGRSPHRVEIQGEITYGHKLPCYLSCPASYTSTFGLMTLAFEEPAHIVVSLS